MKQFIAFFIFGYLLATLLSGCGESAAPGAPVTETASGGGDSQQSIVEHYEALCIENNLPFVQHAKAQCLENGLYSEDYCETNRAANLQNLQNEWEELKAWAASRLSDCLHDFRSPSTGACLSDYEGAFALHINDCQGAAERY